MNDLLKQLVYSTDSKTYKPIHNWRSDFLFMWENISYMLSRKSCLENISFSSMLSWFYYRFVIYEQARAGFIFGTGK